MCEIIVIMKKIKRMSIVLLVILLFLFSIHFSLNISALSDAVTDDPLVLIKMTNEVSYIETEMIIDKNNEIHHFVRLSYYNGTFVLFHVVEDSLIIIDKNFFSTGLFEAHYNNEGVYLFYSYASPVGGSVIKMYSWSEVQSSLRILLTTQEYFERANIIIMDDSFNFLYSTYHNETHSTIIHVEFNGNGNLIQFKYFYVPFSYYDIVSFVMLDGQLFSLNVYQYYNDINQTNIFQIIIVGYTEYGYYNSSIINTNLNWAETKLVVGKDDLFHLSVLTYGDFYSANFGVNETIDFSSFLFTTINYYYGSYDVFSYINKTFYVFSSTSRFFYIEKNSFDNQYSIIPKFIVVTAHNQSLSVNTLILEGGVNSYEHYATEAYIFENASYIFSYTSLLSKKETANYYVIGKSIIALKLCSDLILSILKAPLLFNLNSLSPIAFFFTRYWIAFVVPISVLGLTYGIFYKRINRGLSKLKLFLLRPITDDTKKVKLVLVNLWLFIQNAFTLILTLWKSNKRRLIISLLGFTILATIVITSTTLFDSKRSYLVFDFISNFDVNNNNEESIYFEIPIDRYSTFPSGIINPNITQFALNEIEHVIQTRTVLFSTITPSYQYSLSSQLIGFNLSIYHLHTRTLGYIGYSNNYSTVIESFLQEGSLPNMINETVISTQLATERDIDIGDEITINATTSHYVESFELKVVGIYLAPSDQHLLQICKEKGLPFDPINIIASEVDMNMLVPADYYLSNMGNISDFNFDISGRIQFLYDFSQFPANGIYQLDEDVRNLDENGPYIFPFSSGGYWTFNNEFYYALFLLDSSIRTIQFLILFLSIPIIYLAWFLIFEVNELFGASFEQEIQILRSKGVSTGSISFIYLTMKIIEVILSTALGFLLTLSLVPPLMSIDKFLSFKSTIGEINLSSLPIALSVSFVLLLFISLPRIIRMSQTKIKVEKPPKKFVQLLKNLRLHYLLIIIFGAGITVLSYWLFYSFGGFFSDYENNSLILVFVYLMGVGAMIILLGLGLFLRDLHKIFVIIFSKISWRTSKSKFSFSLVDVRSDVNLFNNSFMTYVIIIGIIMPFVVSPLAIQNRVQVESLFAGGSDLFIDDWNSSDLSILPKLANYEEIISFTNITIYRNIYRLSLINTLVFNNTGDFVSTSYEPPEYIIPDWKHQINKLEEDQMMLVSTSFYLYMAREENFFIFDGPSFDVSFDIGSVFEYFPIFLTEASFYSYFEHHIVTNKENYFLFNKTTSSGGVSRERLLIKLRPLVNQIKFAERLRRELNINIEATAEDADSMLFQNVPFYPVIVSELVFGILICIAAVVFISISNPLKILQKRITKNDVLKKIGIPTNSIIFVSALEFLTVCVLPGLVIGGAAGYGLVRLFGFLFLGSGFGGAHLPYVVQFPVSAMLLIFIGIPLLFFGIFFAAMKVNFIRFRPRNLE